METQYDGNVQVRIDKLQGTTRIIRATLPRYLVPQYMEQQGMTESDITEYIDKVPSSHTYMLSLLLGIDISPGSIIATPMRAGSMNYRRSMTARIVSEIKKLRFHEPHTSALGDDSEHEPRPISRIIPMEQFHLLSMSLPSTIDYDAPMVMAYVITIDGSLYAPILRCERGIIVYRIVSPEYMNEIHIVKKPRVYNLMVSYNGAVYVVDGTDVRMVQCLA